MSRLLQNLLIIFLLISNEILAGDLPTSLHGEGRRTIVNVTANNSVLYVEYCHSNISGVWLTRFDTLKLVNNKYVGLFSEIETKDKNYFFKPKNIKLSEGQSDTSFNKFGNDGYLNYMDKQLTKTLAWTGADLGEFKSAKWERRCSDISNCMEFRRQTNNTLDSIRNYFKSDLPSRKYNRLVIKSYRFFSKKQIITDSLKINKVWKYLSHNKPSDRKLFPYIIQMPMEFALLSLYDVDIALMAQPFVYSALIGSEIFVGNRLHARSTFKLKLYPAGKDCKKLKLKVRKNGIITSNYIYQLSADIRTVLKDL